MNYYLIYEFMCEYIRNNYTIVFVKYYFLKEIGDDMHWQ